MNLVLNTNMVAVRPMEQEHELFLGADDNEMKHLSVRGKVVDFSEHRDFYREAMNFDANLLTPAHLELVQLANEFCLPVSDANRIRCGEEVLFSYRAYLESDQEGWWEKDSKGRKVLVMRYDMLYFNFSTLTPLNRLQFVEPIGVTERDLVRDGIRVYYDRESLPGIGRVIYGSLKGKIVHFSPVQVAPEYKYHQTMNPAGLPLLKIPESEVFVNS